jgi:uncharacterized membrane protein
LLWLIIAEPYIKSFESFIDVHKDGVIVVRERIVVDFGEEERHGIYRTIPYYFQGRKLEFNLISVEDDSGSSYQVWEEKNDVKVYWRIGDPEVLVKGENVYNITYEVKGAINYFKEHDEIYWNVNGTEWEMGINEVSCVVNLPKGVDVSKVKYTFYTGKKGSREQNGKAWVEGNKVFFKAGPFKPGENLTIVVGLPKGVLTKPSWISRNWGLLFMIFLPLISLWYMLSQYFRYGRDPRIGRSIRIEYDPPDNLKPAEIGTLVGEYADDRDIVATIIDLAIRGYLKIRPLTDREVEIEILREGDDLKGYEKKIFEAIKESAKDGKVLKLGESVRYKKLHKTLESVKYEVYDLMTQRGYFQENPDAVRKKYTSLGSLMFIIALLIPFLIVLINVLILLFNIDIKYLFFTMVIFYFIIAIIMKIPAMFHIVFLTALLIAFLLVLINGFIFGVSIDIKYLFPATFIIFLIMFMIRFISPMVPYLLDIFLAPFDRAKKFYRALYIIAPFILFIAIVFIFFRDIIDAIRNIINIIRDVPISVLHHPFIEVPLGIALAGEIISIMGQHIPKKTEKGVEMYKRVLGFREFIKRVEEDRLKRMDPTKLERIIPYAIVLGIEDIWIEKISKVINYIPDWIQTSTRDVREAISITISSLSVSLSTVVSYRTS